MECAKCRTSGFNRVIIDVQSGDILGGLCTNCDGSEIPVRSQQDPEGGSTCVHCPQSGDIAIPILECEIDYKGELLIEYDLDRGTPRFCEDCAPIPLVDQDQALESVSDRAI
jgi:hypothetical protein